MDPSELDNALEELENRLERLRALYQQYFLGIEKIEPSVARKDVDRRIWLLRREQIRNTGKRFKLNVLVQRYNTFQQYWVRICREIENGTYVRHLQRAQRAFDDEKLLTIAARRRGSKRQHDESDPEEAAAAEDESSQQRLPSDLEARLEAGLDPMEDLRQAMDEALGSSSAPAPGRAGEAVPARVPRAPPVPRSGRGISPFDLELDEGPARQRPDDADSEGTTSSPSAAQRPTMVEQVGAPAPAPAHRPAAVPITSTARHAAPGSPKAAPRPAPTERRAAAPGAPAIPRPTPSAERRPAEIAPGAPQSNLDAGRLKELHARLIDAKRSTGDLGTVTEEALAKSLRAAETKLLQQHGTQRRVDFDIVIKDGKAVVKPIVR